VTRLTSPDASCVEVDIGPARYRGRRLDVVNEQHARMLKQVGYFDPGPGGVSRAAGFRCPTCGFGSFFRDCSRCRQDLPHPIT
jgi:hypothetical protein